MESSDDEDWRTEVEFSTHALHVGGRFTFAVTQQDELPPFAALAMLAELGESASEISGKRVWAGSQVLCAHLVAHSDGRNMGSEGAEEELLFVAVALPCADESTAELGVSASSSRTHPQEGYRRDPQ